MASRIQELEADLHVARSKNGDLEQSLQRLEMLYERQQQLLDRFMAGVS